MEVTSAHLRKGFPKIIEAPNCCVCHAPKAFVVSPAGIVCGQCFMKHQTVHEENILLEAAHILQNRGLRV